MRTPAERGVQTFEHLLREGVHTVKQFETNRRGGDGRRRRPEVYKVCEATNHFGWFALPIEGK